MMKSPYSALLHAEKLRGETRHVAVARHVQHAEWDDLAVAYLGFLGAQNARQHPVDLANEGEPVALPRAAPKALEESVEALSRSLVANRPEA